jgi:ABC-type multidrug transport system fused ATPase/permease subunit
LKLGIFSNQVLFFRDILKIQEAMSEKVGLCLFTATNFTLLVAQSYYYGWKLSLLLSFALPPIFIITYLQAKWSNWLTTKEQQVSSAIATVAQEVITNIRTVVAFNGQEKEAGRYDRQLRLAKKLSFKKGAVLGLGHGLNWLCCFLNYSLAFWFGTRLVIESRERGDDEYGPDTIVVVRHNEE